MEDVRFVIEENPEPDDPSTTHYVQIIGLESGDVLESHICGNPYGMVEAYRENQMFKAEGFDQQDRIDFYRRRGVDGVD